MSTTRKPRTVIVKNLRMDIFTVVAIAKIFKTRTKGLFWLSHSFPHLYKATLGEMKGLFSRDEIMALCECQSGAKLSPEMAGRVIIPSVRKAIALGGMAKNVDGKSLLKKVKALSTWERACLEVFIESLWHPTESTANLEANIKALI